MPSLIPSSTLLSMSDRIGLIYKTLREAVGEAATGTVTTLDDSGVTSGSAPGPGDTIQLASAPEDLPASGLLRIGEESIRYRSYTGSIFVVEERGADDTPASAHTDGETAYLPTTVFNEAHQLYDDLLSLGNSYGQVIDDLTTPFRASAEDAYATRIAGNIVGEFITALDYGHLSVRGRTLDLSISDLGSYAQYVNGVTPYSMLYSEDFGRMVWQCEGANRLLPDATVFPNRTTLVQGQMSAGPTLTPLVKAELNRYGPATPDRETYRPGFAAARVRIRCISAGNGTVDVSLDGEGMDADMAYFGRSSGGGESGNTADDDPDPHTWTGLLDLTSVGNAVELTPDVTGDRILKALSLTRTGGTATTGTFVVETIPERLPQEIGTFLAVDAGLTVETFTQGDGGAWDASVDTRGGGTASHYTLTLSHEIDPSQPVFVSVGGFPIYGFIIANNQQIVILDTYDVDAGVPGVRPILDETAQVSYTPA